jgi:hypothetical protein
MDANERQLEKTFAYIGVYSRLIAEKVVDIFGNDTMTIVEVTI